MRGLLLSASDAASEIQLRSTSNGHSHLCFAEWSLMNENWFLNTRDYFGIVSNDWNSWVRHWYSKLFARKRSWKLMATASSFEFSIKHSNHKSNPEKFNGKRSIKTVRGTQGRYRTFRVIILHVLSRPVMLFFVNKASYPIQIGLILFPF